MKNCKKCNRPFEIREADRGFYKRFDVPEPEMCPDCRLQHKLCFRNERTLYKNKSAMSGASIISIYAPDSKYKCISPQEWWSEKHEALEYGQDFDFNRPFFEQFQELLLKVPRISLFNINPTNSDYCQQAYDNKNCYLCMVLEKCEDCMYVSHSNGLRDCFDCIFLHDCELCYECLDSNKLYACIGCQSCQNSSELINCYDCIGCKNCIGCYGLRNKQYYIMNEPHTREQYEVKLKMLELNKYSKYQNARRFFEQFIKGLPHRANWNLNVEESSGNYLINCKNALECFDSFELQDCSYCTWVFTSHDCHDVYGMGHGSFVLEGLGVEKLNNSAFNTFVSDSSDCWYSDVCFHSMYLFGCTGLKHKKYCILNKEYMEKEYENLKAKIIEHMKKTGEWGQFFPTALSPFSYNETAANYRFPLSEETALENGFSWCEPDPKEYLKQDFEMTDDLACVDAGICDKILACADCGKNYKIMPKELNFYRKRNVALPRKCTDCRFLDRFKLRNPRNLYERKCEKCAMTVSSSFAPAREEKIYCETCYKQLVN
ncbi:hypothetical protein HYW82_02920 [Candidatus Peregrinibacteria bacterium]|nr:hypothetical protein [Candidatus Peregrinibacteria bacterium]